MIDRKSALDDAGDEEDDGMKMEYFSAVLSASGL